MWVLIHPLWFWLMKEGWRRQGEWLNVTALWQDRFNWDKISIHKPARSHHFFLTWVWAHDLPLSRPLPSNWGNRVVPCLSLSHFRLRLRIAVVCVTSSSKIVTNFFLYRDITKFLVKAFYLNSLWLWRQSFSVVRLRKRLRRLEVPASW